LFAVFPDFDGPAFQQAEGKLSSHRGVSAFWQIASPGNNALFIHKDEPVAHSDLETPMGATTRIWPVARGGGTALAPLIGAARVFRYVLEISE
jgi:hypothetical protein